MKIIEERVAANQSESTTACSRVTHMANRRIN